jgi:hypothetical protein
MPQPETLGSFPFSWLWDFDRVIFQPRGNGLL